MPIFWDGLSLGTSSQSCARCFGMIVLSDFALACLISINWQKRCSCNSNSIGHQMFVALRRTLPCRGVPCCILGTSRNRLWVVQPDFFIMPGTDNTLWLHRRREALFWLLQLHAGKLQFLLAGSIVKSLLSSLQKFCGVCSPQNPTSPLHSYSLLLSLTGFAQAISELMGEPAVLYKEKINFKLPGAKGWLLTMSGLF